MSSCFWWGLCIWKVAGVLAWVSDCLGPVASEERSLDRASLCSVGRNLALPFSPLMMGPRQPETQASALGKNLTSKLALGTAIANETASKTNKRNKKSILDLNEY